MSGPLDRPLSSPLRRLVVASMGIGLLATACGQEFDRAAAVESFQAANPEVSAAQADCVVDGLIERYGLDGLADELGDPSNRSDGFTEAQFRQMFACGVEGDVAQQLTEQLEANGVPAEQAPCVADELTGDLDDAGIDVLLSGDITDEFMATFVAAMETCGAVGSSGG